jgi:hypothetical protein
MLLCENFRNAGLTPNTNSIYLGYALTNSEWSIVNTFAYNLSKTDIVFAGSILVAIVKYTTKVRSMVKAREARSPDETGIEKTNTLTK